MDKDKMDAMVNAVTGLTYMEWKLIADQIEREFQTKMNRTAITPGESQQLSARIAVELDGYFSR